MKRSKTKRISNSFYFTILDSINEGKTLSDIASNLKLSKQLFNYYIRPLKVYKAISKIGYGVWEVNQENFKKFLEVKQVKKTYGNGSKNIRGHAYKFCFKIPRVKGWKNRIQYLEKNNINVKIIPQGQRIIINNFKVWLCSRSIIINFPKGKSYFSEKGKDAYLYALFDCKQIMVRLENMFSINLKINNKFKYKISRHHYAHIENNLAKEYINKNKVLFIRDKLGILWGLIDNSFNFKEFETLNTSTAINDMDKIIKPYFDDLGELKMSNVLNDRRDNPELLLPSEHQKLTNSILQTQKDSSKIQESISNNQLLFSENIETHISAIQKLGNQVELFVSETKRLSKTINKLEKRI